MQCAHLEVAVDSLNLLYVLSNIHVYYFVVLHVQSYWLKWLKACCASEADRAGEVCVLVVDACEGALDAHGPAIAAASGAPALGVDLSREDRIKRCTEAQQRFRAVAAACAGIAFFGDAAARASKFAARCGGLFP